MPHPERTKDETIKHMLDIIVKSKEASNSQKIFHEKVTDLMNSEHISYKSTRKYLKNYTQKEGFYVVQGPEKMLELLILEMVIVWLCELKVIIIQCLLTHIKEQYRRRRNNERYIYHGSKTDRYIRFLTFWK